MGVHYNGTLSECNTCMLRQCLSAGHKQKRRDVVLLPSLRPAWGWLPNENIQLLQLGCDVVLDLDTGIALNCSTKAMEVSTNCSALPPEISDPVLND